MCVSLSGTSLIDLPLTIDNPLAFDSPLRDESESLGEALKNRLSIIFRTSKQAAYAKQLWGKSALGPRAPGRGRALRPSPFM